MAGYLVSSRHQQAFIDPPDRIGKFTEGLRCVKDKVVAILRDAHDQLPEPAPQTGSPRSSANAVLEHRSAASGSRRRRAASVSSTTSTATTLTAGS